MNSYIRRACCNDHLLSAHLPYGSRVVVNPLDALDLQKLTASELQWRGFEKNIAKLVSKDLLSGRLVALGNSVGLELMVDSNAPVLGK